MTVRELLSRLDSRELAEWQAFASLEPFGEERADLRSATVALAVYRSQGIKGLKLSDFMPRFEPKEPMSPAAIQTAMHAWLGTTPGSPQAPTPE